MEPNCAGALSSGHGHGSNLSRRSSARMAAAPPHEPARPRGRRRDLHPPPELCRKRPRAAVTRDGAASRRAARGAAARPQPAAWCRRATRRCSPSGRSAIPRSRRRARRSSWCSKATSRIRRSPSTATGRCSTRTERWRRCSPAPAPALLKPPVNVLRLSLHPAGLAPRIANLAEWRAHLLERLRKQIEVSADPVLVGAARRAACAAGAESAAAAAAGATTPTTPAWSVPLQLVDRGRRPVVPEHHHGVRHPGRRHAVGDRARVLLPGRPAATRSSALRRRSQQA